MNPINLFFFAAAANVLLIPLFIRLAHKRGWVDRPGHRKIHDKSVPELGGLAVMSSVLATVCLEIFFFGPVRDLGLERDIKIGLILGSTLLAGLLGFLDDLYDLRPRLKLLSQACLFSLFIFAGFRFEILHLPGTAPVGLGAFSFPLTLLWILAVVNGFNFMDGIDGLAGSITAVILLGTGAATLILGGPIQTGVLWSSALGAVLAFLFFNWRPAKIYMGDAGSNALGALVALSLVSLGQNRPALFSFTNYAAPDPSEPFRFQLMVATLLAGYPLLEVCLSTLRRGFKRFVLGRSLESSEQEHMHHQFRKLGWGAGSICGLAVLFQIVLAGAGLLVMVKQNALATWILVPLFMGLAYAGPRIGFLDFLKLRRGKEKAHFLIANHYVSIQKAKLGLAHNREEILALVSQTCREFGVRCYRFKIKPDKEGKGGIDYQYQNEDMGGTKKLERISSQASAASSDEFFDYCEIPGHRGEAFWLFEYHTSRDELDVEYRVLVSSFMRDALAVTILVSKGEESLEVPSLTKLPHHRTSSHSLRKRQKARRD
jgi:UDP-GlcNAc:undecaprenyl-phosphate/decaprenyl-phosphate GlcNAc-1-phosphate transferase